MSHVTAYDTSHYCCEMYEHNFPSNGKDSVRNKLVEMEEWIPASACLFFKLATIFSRERESTIYAFCRLTFVCRIQIEGVKGQELEGADLWAMSPPCQPFTTTRGSKQRGGEDKRCNALKYLMKTLALLQRPPQWFLLENVKAFFGSDMHQSVLSSLAACGYSWKEFQLSPLQIGIPNSRARYVPVDSPSVRDAS